MTRLVSALLISTVGMLGGADVAAGKPDSSSIAIRGKDKWVSVGALKGSSLRLEARSRRKVTAGVFTFPEGKLPPGARRTYEGITIATVRIRPSTEVNTGIDYMWSSVGHWAYAMFQAKRTKKRECPNAVKWSAGGMINGPQGGIDCDGIIRFKTVNELTYGSVRPGPRPWTFHLESLGKPLIESVTVSRRSRIGITRLTPSRVKIFAPENFNLPDGEESSVRVRIKNRGGRPARGLSVSSWVDDGNSWMAHRRTRKLRPLGPGKSRQVRIPVAALPDGIYTLYLSAGGANGYGDDLAYRYVVGQSQEATERHFRSETAGSTDLRPADAP